VVNAENRKRVVTPRETASVNPTGRENAPRPGPQSGRPGGFTFRSVPQDQRPAPTLVSENSDAFKGGVPAFRATGCAYIVGKRGLTHFMCDKPLGYRNYCTEHAAICYYRKAA